MHGEKPRRRREWQRRHHERRYARDADDGAIYRDQGRQSGLPACSTGWGIFTSCSSTTPKSHRARSASRSPSAASISAATSRCAACRSNAADDYLQRLIALGHRVAVCEQIEDPAEARKRGGKSVVRRDVVRLVTPGTLTEDALLEARRNNWLLAVARGRPASDAEPIYGLAWLDISTGEFRVSEADGVRLAAEIARLEPGEMIVADAVQDDPELRAYWRSLAAISPVTQDVVRRRERGAKARWLFWRRDGGLVRIVFADRIDGGRRRPRPMSSARRFGKRPSLSPPVARGREFASMLIDAATRTQSRT